MKNIYVIVSCATNPMKSESKLWESLRSNGWVVRDIHENPRILENEIISATARIALLTKNRCSNYKKVFVIALVTTADILMKREPWVKETEINAQLADTERIVLEADAWFLEDDLLRAAESIKGFISEKEGV